MTITEINGILGEGNSPACNMGCEGAGRALDLAGPKALEPFTCGQPAGTSGLSAPSQ